MSTLSSGSWIRKVAKLILRISWREIRSIFLSLRKSNRWSSKIQPSMIWKQDRSCSLLKLIRAKRLIFMQFPLPKIWRRTLSPRQSIKHRKRISLLNFSKKQTRFFRIGQVESLKVVFFRKNRLRVTSAVNRRQSSSPIS